MGLETPNSLEAPDTDRERILNKVKNFFQSRLDELESSEKCDEEEEAQKRKVESVLDDMSDENYESASLYLTEEISKLQDILKTDISEDYRARLEVWRAEAQGLRENLNLSEK